MTRFCRFGRRSPTFNLDLLPVDLYPADVPLPVVDVAGETFPVVDPNSCTVSAHFRCQFGAASCLPYEHCFDKLAAHVVFVNILGWKLPVRVACGVRIEVRLYDVDLHDVLRAVTRHSSEQVRERLDGRSGSKQFWCTVRLDIFLHV